ncbi:MAG: universal stress protein [Alphaproteobacteria bacterium]|nr:universal stress protein [Alphaproteobacteria bacterium]
MSSIKSLIAVIEDANSRASLESALAIGRAFSAHVTALHVKADPSNAVPLLGEGMSGGMIEEMMSVAEKEANEKAKLARAMFDEIVAAAKIPLIATPPAPSEASVAFYEEAGLEEEIVARKGRLADLIVLTRPEGETDLPAATTLNAALFETGRPVLMTGKSLSEAARRIAIAWNGSAEAARALAAAMPFLTRDGVSVALLVGEEEGRAAYGRSVQEYLAWHGVACEIRLFAAHGGQTGESLLHEMEQFKADMLVMGAYTHSRLRQLIMGGVTRHVVANCSVPVLFAH